MNKAHLAAADALRQAFPDLAASCTTEQLAALLPEFLPTMRAVLLSRAKCPTPQPMIVNSDLSEERPR